jgi:tripartite-type tricarboxylate transporter receptor subunit TctC
MDKISFALMRALIPGMLVAIASAAFAQPSYPAKPIRFIVPFPPGGSTNFVARLVGQKLSENLGQQVIVDNRPGGNTIIGSEAVAKAAPDGYTWLFATSSLVINPHFFTNLPYDPFKDFAPVATLARVEYLLAVHPSVPANNLQEFIAYAKSKPGELNFASSSSGGTTQLAGELFNIMAGVKMQHIPYKGGGPAFTDLVAGQVQLAFNNAVNVLPYAKSGRLKALAISGESRSPAMPQVPTFSEAGLPGFSAKEWFGVVVPAQTPRTTIDTASSEIGKVMALPDIIEKLTSQGVDPFISTPEQMAALMKADNARYGKVIKAANIKLEQ